MPRLEKYWAAASAQTTKDFPDALKVHRVPIVYGGWGVGGNLTNGIWLLSLYCPNIGGWVFQSGAAKFPKYSNRETLAINAKYTRGISRAFLPLLRNPGKSPGWFLGEIPTFALLTSNRSTGKCLSMSYTSNRTTPCFSSGKLGCLIGW